MFFGVGRRGPGVRGVVALRGTEACEILWRIMEKGVAFGRNTLAIAFIIRKQVHRFGLKPFALGGTGLASLAPYIYLFSCDTGRLQRPDLKLGIFVAQDFL